jgi:hypothetical protein
MTAVGSHSSPLARPVYLQQRTYLVTTGTAVECQTRTLQDLFDHLVGAGEHGWRDGQARRFRGLEVDHQLY